MSTKLETVVYRASYRKVFLRIFGERVFQQTQATALKTPLEDFEA